MLILKSVVGALHTRGLFSVTPRPTIEAGDLEGLLVIQSIIIKKEARSYFRTKHTPLGHS